MNRINQGKTRRKRNLKFSAFSKLTESDVRYLTQLTLQNFFEHGQPTAIRDAVWGKFQSDAAYDTAVEQFKMIMDAFLMAIPADFETVTSMEVG